MSRRRSSTSVGGGQYFHNKGFVRYCNIKYSKVFFLYFDKPICFLEYLLEVSYCSLYISRHGRHGVPSYLLCLSHFNHILLVIECSYLDNSSVSSQFSGHQFCYEFLPLLLGCSEVPSRTEDLAEISDCKPRSYLFKPNIMKSSFWIPLTHFIQELQ